MSSAIEYSRFSRGESCTEGGCKAKRYYIEDGKKFCQRGHEQTGFTQTQRDDDDWKDTGKKSRKLEVDKPRAERILSGRDAFELYLSCYQLILWKQCHWLVNAKGFPPELEIIVKDLWSLRVGALLKLGDEKSAYGSASGTLWSSGGEGDNTEDTDASGGRSASSRRSKTIVGEGSSPKLIETLGLCYLGMLLLRLPIGIGEIFKWVVKDEMVYTRAIKEVPKEMRNRLPAQHYSALEIRAPLKGSSIHGVVLELVEFYNRQFDMEFPSLNSPLLIFKHVRDLGLPIEIYAATRRLATLLEFDFSYPILHQRAYTTVSYPEIQLICMIVVATKLCYPFDDIERSPQSHLDPTTSKIDWEKWRDTMIEKPAAGLKRGEEIMVTDTDVLGMNDKQMDDYMDWYQRTWMDDRNSKMAEQILEFFPLKELPPQLDEEPNYERIVDLVKQVQSNLIVQKPKPIKRHQNDDIKQPGELYRRYRSTQDLPDDAKAFFGLAAQNTGIRLKTLVRGVFQLELRLEKMELAERKRNLSAKGQRELSSEDE
ncbi:Ubiquitin-like protein [Venustampulla echinocandica]|uniref:Ubiquitin-like protein n=1 Tax=Venustampulla echinocandica TaxID=2656787 RepID=A0A370TFK9_9HELO|nr:Ubiquitin-like protein [Venustampulla echinocandica]RDL33685.1 Ubiquitin-like protein [Venustampulla echinocandica]